MKRKKPRQYRKIINEYKHIKKHGLGWFIPWKPEDFRSFAKEWREIQIFMVVFYAVGAVCLILYILHKIFM